MAISLVGVKTFTVTGTGTVDFSTIGTILENDFVVLSLSFPTARGNSVNTNINTSFTSQGFQNHVAASENASVSGSGIEAHFYTKRMGATPDTSITIPAGYTFGPNVLWSGTVTVLRGVHTSSAIDVAGVSASATGSSLANPPSITPLTNGDWVIATYHAAQNSVGSWGTPSNLTNFTQINNGISRSGVGTKTNWTSGAFDPAAVTNSTTSQDAWAAFTVALKANPNTYNIESTIPGVSDSSSDITLKLKATSSLSGTGSLTGDATSFDPDVALNIVGHGSISATIRDIRPVTATLNGSSSHSANPIVAGTTRFFEKTYAQTGVNTYAVGFPVKKDSVGRATRNGLIRVSGLAGTPKVAEIQFDSATGEHTEATANNWVEAGVMDIKDDWFVYGVFTTNADNTTLQIDFSPCAGVNFVLDPSATGTMSVREPVVAKGDKYTLGRDFLLAVFTKYANELAAIDAAVSTEDAKRADWSRVNSMPTNIAALTGDEVLDNSAILSSIANDDVIAVTEKYDLARSYSDLEGRYNDAVSRASAVGQSTTNVSAARTNFLNVLNSYSPAWNDTSADTLIHTNAFPDKDFPTGWTLTNATAAANGIYTTLTDSDGSNYGLASRSITQTGANTYSVGLVVKKDSTVATTRFCLLRMTRTGDAAGNTEIMFNTSTGASAFVGSPTVAGVLDLGAEWFILLQANVSSSCTAVGVEIYPAVGSGTLSSANYTAAKTGSVDVRSPLLALGDANKLGHFYLTGRLNNYAKELTKLWSSISAADAFTAQPTGMPPISTANLRYKFTGSISMGTLTAGSPATGTVSVGAGSLLAGDTSISYNAMSAGLSGTGGTTATYHLYVNSNGYTSGAHTLQNTTNAQSIYNSDSNVYIGSVTVTWPTSGTSSGSGGEVNTGSGTCVWEDAFVHTKRGWIKASEVLVGDEVRVLTNDRTELEWEPVESNEEGKEFCYIVQGCESGIEVTISRSTPITLMNGDIIRAHEINGHLLPFEAGDDLWWEPCYIKEDQVRKVRHIKCNMKTYSAGNVSGRGILTHNPKP